MAVFKKDKAAYYEKMGSLTEVTITEEKVKFSLNYSSHTISLEELPKLLGDIMQLYASAKPILDRKSVEARKKSAQEAEQNIGSDEPIDLSDIPF